MGKVITVDFREDTIFAIQRDDGVFVALKPISDSLGLKWHGQFERLQRDPILAEGIRVTRIPSVGGAQETTCLRLDLVNGWLFTIDEARVKPEFREKILAYKRECYRVLFEHFHPQRHAEAIETGELLQPPHAEQRPFPDWTLEELRTKGQTLDRYRITLGLPAAQWIMPQLGFPLPPPEILRHSRQIDLFSIVDDGNVPLGSAA